MIVEVYIRCFASAAIPPENEPPPLIDADRAKPFQFAAQLFEMVTWRHAQVLVSRRVIKYLELPKQSSYQLRRDIPRPNIIHEEVAQPIVPEAGDHPCPQYELVYRSMGQASSKSPTNTVHLAEQSERQMLVAARTRRAILRRIANAGLAALASAIAWFGVRINA